MKKLYVLFLVCFSFGYTQNLQSIREQYIASNATSKTANEFKNTMAKFHNSKETVVKAYYAASIIMASKFETKLKDKKEAFKEGVTLLEAEIKKNPNLAELRLIRLSIQENVPKITGYKKNITEDKQLLIKNFNSQEASLKEHIRKFVKQSKSISETEKANFK